ncbi:MAG: hypothetical protein CM15mP18_1080 [Methanobacteriota archaeon]|nr:MAG: hypothetical protein CM15mP18_1080 [Euryarchaeota archaeon]
MRVTPSPHNPPRNLPPAGTGTANLNPSQRLPLRANSTLLSSSAAGDAPGLPQPPRRRLGSEPTRSRPRATLNSKPKTPFYAREGPTGRCSTANPTPVEDARGMSWACAGPWFPDPKRNAGRTVPVGKKSPDIVSAPPHQGGGPPEASGAVRRGEVKPDLAHPPSSTPASHQPFFPTRVLGRFVLAKKPGGLRPDRAGGRTGAQKRLLRHSDDGRSHHRGQPALIDRPHARGHGRRTAARLRWTGAIPGVISPRLHALVAFGGFFHPP